MILNLNKDSNVFFQLRRSFKRYW